MGFAFAAPALTIGLAWFAWTVPPLVPGLRMGGADSGSPARWLRCQ